MTSTGHNTPPNSHLDPGAGFLVEYGPQSGTFGGAVDMFSQVSEKQSCIGKQIRVRRTFHEQCPLYTCVAGIHAGGDDC